MITRIGVGQNQNTNFKANWTKNAQNAIRNNAVFLSGSDIDAVGRISGHAPSSHITLDLVESEQNVGKYDLVASSTKYPNGKTTIAEDFSVNDVLEHLAKDRESAPSNEAIDDMLKFVEKKIKYVHDAAAETKKGLLDAIFAQKPQAE